MAQAPPSGRTRRLGDPVAWMLALGGIGLAVQLTAVALGEGAATCRVAIPLTLVTSGCASVITGRRGSPWLSAMRVWLGVGMVLFGGSALGFFASRTPGSPDVATPILGLLGYAALFAAVIAFLERNPRILRSAVWLSAGALGTVLFVTGWEILYESVRASGAHALDLEELMPVLFDLILLSLVTMVGYSSGWRLGPALWGTLVSFGLLLAADSTMARQLGTDAYARGGIVDLGAPTAFWAMAALTTLPVAPVRLRTPWHGAFNVLTLGIVVASIGLLIQEARTDASPIVMALCGLPPVLIAIRLMLTVAENRRLAGDNESIVRSAGDGILKVGPDGRITGCNPAAARLLGYSPTDLIGANGHRLVHHSHPDGEPYPAEDCPILSAIRLGRTRRIVDEVFWRRDGTAMPVDYTCAPVRTGGRLMGAVIVFNDVTADRDLKARLRHEAEHDPLSGLLNRRRFVSELEAELESGTRCGAVVIVDLDSFKFVNDSFGHRVGDSLIVQVAQSVAKRLRSSDALGRLGGDEFAVLLRGADPEASVRVATGLLETIRRGTEPSIQASAGVAVFDRSTRVTPEDLLVAADLALYRAKEEGRGRAVLYTGEHGRRLTWVERVRAAIANDRLVLHAQPIVDLRTGAVVRDELLVRMLADDGDIIPPAAFIPTAEKFALMGQIDRMVVARAVEIAWDRPVSVNVSGQSLADPDLLAAVTRAVRAGLDPSHVTFEVTETAAIFSVKEARAFAQRLENLGCRLALDDFGTGFSSLSYLRNLPVQEVKIDREFVHTLADTTIDRHIVAAVVGIAHHMGQTTVAEGIEDARTLATLVALGVDLGQGNLLGRPQPLEEARPDTVSVELRDLLAVAAQPAC